MGAQGSRQAMQAVLRCLAAPCTTSLHDLQASFAPRRIVSLVLLPDLRMSHGSATRTSLETDLLGMHATVQAGLAAHLLQARHKHGVVLVHQRPTLLALKVTWRQPHLPLNLAKLARQHTRAEPAANTSPVRKCALYCLTTWRCA